MWCVALISELGALETDFQWRSQGLSAHPEPQIEEQNGEKLRKDDRKSRRMKKNWGNVAFLITQGWESDYAPADFIVKAGSFDFVANGVLWTEVLRKFQAFRSKVEPNCASGAKIDIFLLCFVFCLFCYVLFFVFVCLFLFCFVLFCFFFLFWSELLCKLSIYTLKSKWSING